jgi:hypothetical protein
MLVITDDASVEAVRVEVAAPLMTAIERLRMAERERMHSARHVLQLAEHDEVAVVSHQAEGKEAPVRSQRGEPKKSEEAGAIVIVDEDVAAVDAAHRHVVCAVLGEVVSSQPGHRSTVTTARSNRIGAIGRDSPSRVPGTVPTM